MNEATIRRVAPMAAIGLVLGLIKAEQLADPNVLWGTRDGLDVTSHWHLTRTDTWSWTVTGKSWIPNSWGWDVVLGELHRWGGAAALAALNVVVVVAVVTSLGFQAQRLGAPTLAIVAVVGGVGGIVLLPWINDRPQLISYLLTLPLVALVRAALRADRRGYLLRLAVIGAVQCSWINLHFFGIVGPGIVLVAGIGYIAAHGSHHDAQTGNRRLVVRVAAAALVASAACLLTPYGPVAAAKAITVHSDAAGLVVEWRAAGFATYSQFTALVAIAVGAVATLHAYRARRWDYGAVIIVLCVASAIACRFAPVLAMIALPDAAARTAGVVRGAVLRRMTMLAVTGLVVLAGGIVAAGARDFGRLATASTSPALLARLPRNCRLLNDYQIGGAVIFFRPDMRVAIDSRTDLYGKAAVLGNRELVAGKPGALAHIADDHVSCVLVPSSSGLAQELERTVGWQRAGSDSSRALFVKN